MSDAGGAAGPGRRNDGGTQTGKAILVIVVVMVLGWIVLRHSPSTHGTTAQRTSVSVTTTTVPTTTTTLVAPASIKVQVLNGTGSGNLAGQWSSKLKTTAGYNTLAPDDATSKVTTSAIYVITPGYVPEAYALATAVGLPQSAVNTTVPAPSSAPIPTSERSKADLVLVIGPDLASNA
ncbi:MAG TPA: LytR C-terminal domain-containing protein [Acidimicrobiales bacterium]|nr:LytR C-terminal domain-containing protein [Acidimicrobiales bacterium]